MKKSTKLLSVILAIVMIFSCMSVMASAYETYNDGRESVYTSNDTGLAMLLTDEQRASWFCDLVNNLLASANIKTSIPIIGAIDFTNLDALCDTIVSLRGWVKAGKIGLDLGIVGKLDLDSITGNESVSNAVGMLDSLVTFLDRNVGALGDVIGTGVSFGILGGAIPVDLTAVNKILKNLDDFLKGTIYGLGARKLTGGIGDDPAWPNATLWDDMAAADKPTLDTIVKDLIVNLLTTPRHTENITDPSQNLICTKPADYGATAAMIHNELAVDSAGNPVLDENGNQVTWYYIYGTILPDGTWKFTDESTAANKLDDKHYITHWDVNSSLLKNFDTSILDFETKTLYQMLADALPWAYDTFGAPNLDGQLRATIMQFCGAINRAETDENIIAQLKEKVRGYQRIEDDGAANGRALLSDAMEAAVGEAGNYNFQYISLSGKNINTKPADLYYVVQWGDGWEFYHVDFTQMKDEEKLALFEMINWEWQAPAWSEIMPNGAQNGSYLRNITDAIGRILNTAVVNLEWAYDNASEDNAHFESNVMGLVRKVLKAAPELIYGKNDAYKAKDIDTQSDEKVIAVLGADIMVWLMPALVLPEDVSCLEELVVYGLREFIAEILPEYNWDTQIAAAKIDADYLNIALDMGASIGVYYLKNVMALGTTTDGNGKTSYASPDQYIAPSADCATGWNTKLNYVVDNILKMWVPDLTSKIVSRNATVFKGTDALDKLSIIFNALFPGLLSLISGCSNTIGNGSNKACTVDMKQVKNLLAGILDLKIEPIAAKLYRNDTGYGNKKLYNAVVNILIDLTTGLGFNDSTDYARLVTDLNNALAAANPLDYLVTNANLKTTVKDLLWSITDDANKAMWVQDLLAILMQVTGKMDDMSFKGANLITESVYYGANVTVTPSLTILADGIPSIWYAGGYRSGNRTVDGIYTAVLNKYVVLDFNGNTVTTVDNINANLTLNTAYSGTSIALTPTASMAIYNLQAYVTVTTPDGIVLNNGKPMVINTSFMMTTAAQGDDTAAQIIDDGDKNYDTAFWNIYIDETEPLAKAESYQMTLYNRQTGFGASSREFYISNYGYNVKNADGSITRGAKEDGSGTPTAGTARWTKYINTNTTGITVESGSDPNMPFYWNWNSNPNKKVDKGSSQSYQQWLVDNNVLRSAFPDDFTTLLFTSNSAKLAAGWGTYDWKFSAPYIVIYNSYGLNALINRELASGRQAENYTPESWAAYRTALANAVAEFYAPREAKTFAATHSTNGVSNFKTVSEALTAAVKDLQAATESASTATDYTPEEKAALANLKNVLDAQGKKENLNNKNYIMYRWLKYYNEYAWLNSIYDNAQIPSGVADSKLTGVPSDKIAAAIAAAPADKRDALNAMVVAPTAEESEAAAKARADFLENLPKLDLTSIQVDMAQMAQYESRLISRSPAVYYLRDAYNMANAITNPDAYTAKSWAKFNTARTAAYTVLAEATSTPAQIHEARYNLLVAYKALTKAGTDVDLTALRDVMAYVDTICANPTLFRPTAASDYKTLDEALAAVFAEAGVKVTVGKDTYYIGGGDTGAAWLDEAGMRTALEGQETVDRIVKEIKAELANIESTIKVVPNDKVTGNTTYVDYANLIIDGIKPGTINSDTALLALVKTTAPDGKTAKLTVSASAANGYGTGTKVVLTVDGIEGFEIKHTVMVYGDVNGDGAIDAFDAALINMNISKASALTGDFATAGDTTADGAINASDYAAVVNYAIGAGSIEQTRP